MSPRRRLECSDRRHGLVVSLVCVVFMVWTCVVGIQAEIVNEVVERQIDLTTGVARYSTRITVRNSGSIDVTNYRLAFSSYESRRLAFLSVALENDKDSSSASIPLETRVDGNNVDVILAQHIAPDSSISLLVTSVFISSLKPHPAEVEQSEKARVMFLGSHIMFSPYVTKTQSLRVRLPSSLVEDFAKRKPFRKDGQTILFGPYKDEEPFSESDLFIHFEYPHPILVADRVVKEIEISPWGNIRVEEFVEIRHAGPKLKKPFSRLDFQQNPEYFGGNAMRATTAFLPKFATDIYYRDEIGNISTSMIRYQDEGVLVDLVPRFPLFGGWKTDFYVGYNVPSASVFGTTKSGDFMLRFPFGSSIIQASVRDFELRIILPSGSENIRFEYPFAVDSESQTSTHLYLDTSAKPVYVVRKENLVVDYSVDFQISFSYNRLRMLRQPLLLSGIIFSLFLMGIIYSRLSSYCVISPDLEKKIKHRSS